MTLPTQPTPNGIGSFYRFFGLLVFIGLVGLIVLQRVSHHESNKWDTITYVGMVVLILVIIRPAFMDTLARWLADKIPFINYKKPDENKP